MGIIGYIGEKEANPIILNGLKHLEYRGYDSCGIALIGTNSLMIKKDVGKVEEVHSRLNFLEPPAKLIIAHTRWATHGKVSQENAHPHLSCDSSIAVVHNGIIENYQELKKLLKKKGHKFKSETDTEVISHLVEEEMKKGKELVEAAKSAIRKLKGSYALLLVHKNEKKILAARKGSPLVLGVADHGYFAASDIPAFLDYTKRVVYLHDYDFVVLTSKGFEVFNLLENKAVKRKIDTIEWSAEKAKKGEFEHFMLKEISEQVETIQRAALQDEKIVRKVLYRILHPTKNLFFL